MITFPNAKINLGLHVVRRREDGYHEIESCLYPIADLCDVLEMVPAPELHFHSSGLSIAGNPENNLVLKAFYLLRKRHDIPPVSIHLHKCIPMGAGLGGGSANGAFALKMLNDLFHLQLSVEVLESYASELGSDCPFFIQNRPVIATGTGTHLHPIALDLSQYRIVLRHPNVHVSTAEAYGMVSPKQPIKPLKDLLKLPPGKWQGELINDFEQPLTERFPPIAQAIDELKKEGAIFTAMTGSGSSVFGVFEK